MPYAVTLHWQLVQTEQVFRIPVSQLRERTEFTLLNIRILHTHRHLHIGVPFPLTHNEVALQLTNNAHAHLVAFRPQMHVQRIFQGWSATHSRTSVTRESYARIRKIILLPSSQRPARTQIESRAFVEDLRTLQQPDIVRKSLTFDRHAFAMFHIVDDPRQIRGSCIVVDEIVLHTLEGIAVTHHFACGYVFVEDLPYDLPQPRT